MQRILAVRECIQETPDQVAAQSENAPVTVTKRRGGNNGSVDIEVDTPFTGNGVELHALRHQAVNGSNADLFLSFRFVILRFGNAIIEIDHPLFEGGEGFVFIELRDEVREASLRFEGRDDNSVGASQTTECAIACGKPTFPGGRKSILPQPGEALLDTFHDGRFTVGTIANFDRLTASDEIGITEGAGFLFFAEFTEVIVTFVNARRNQPGFALITQPCYGA